MRPNLTRSAFDTLSRKQPSQTGLRVALFDLVATLLSHPKVDFVHHWNTRWIQSGNVALAQDGSAVSTFYVRLSYQPISTNSMA
ncbi:hypothetical protein WJX75_009259 [Coccomyxa subellipsoidea]|uniref:Uncharacterized protein n=1 Tax=Coccomyxa subellipsoidea TaxID=248742 RepID=A0ABR2YIN2_9CHLO